MSSCGFKPMLAKDSESFRMLDEVRIAKVEGEDKDRLRMIILEEFDNDPHSVPLYDLNIRIKHNNYQQAILKDGQATRYKVNVVLSYRLVDAENKKLVDEGELYLNSGYDTSDSDFKNYIADRNISDNLIRDLCYDLKSKISLILIDKDNIVK